MDGTPTLTRAQARELDRLALEEFGIPELVLMENAGRGAAERILAGLWDGSLPVSNAHPRILILCGAGNNAGDGYVVARHLHIAGLEVVLAETTEPERLSPNAAVNRRISSSMGLVHLFVPNPQSWMVLSGVLEGSDLLVDALLGTGFEGEVRSPLDEIIAAAGRMAQARRMPVVALDVPSGLDVDTGEAANAILRADLTLTFAACKRGFEAFASRPYVGRIEVVSIGAPPQLVGRVLAESGEL